MKWLKVWFLSWNLTNVKELNAVCFTVFFHFCDRDMLAKLSDIDMTVLRSFDTCYYRSDRIGTSHYFFRSEPSLNETNLHKRAWEEGTLKHFYSIVGVCCLQLGITETQDFLHVRQKTPHTEEAGTSVKESKTRKMVAPKYSTERQGTNQPMNIWKQLFRR